jgi:hypothetical protein
MAVAVTRAPARPFARPKAEHGFWSWISTVDHKRIGILYGVTAFLFFVVGGGEALMIRMQLAKPNGTVLAAEEYNQLFTMHGTTMVFLVIMPLAAAFGNYFVPLLIGARDGSSSPAAWCCTPVSSSAAPPTAAGSATPPRPTRSSHRATASTSGWSGW